jgi:DNA-binding beta-propeller fold protein YncE
MAGRMNSEPLRALARICLLFLLTLTLVRCGGSAVPSGGPPPPPPPPPVDPTPGDYIWQLTQSDGIFVSTVNSSTGELGSPTFAGGPADPAVAAIPSKKLLYSPDPHISGEFHGFSMIGPGVQLAELGGAPFLASSPGPIDDLTVDPSGKFLYTFESPSTIEQFSIDSKTGTLIRGASVTEMYVFSQLIVDPTGNFLYALSGGKIFGYRIDRANGSLSTIPGSPFPVPADRLQGQGVVESTGRFLYAIVSTNGVVGFSIDGATGGLTGIVGSPFPTSYQPSCIAVDPSGRFAYVSNFIVGTVDAFNINSESGVLTAIPDSPFSVEYAGYVVVDPSGTFLYMTGLNRTILGFRIDPSSGSLSALTGSPFSSAIPARLMSLRVP